MHDILVNWSPQETRVAIIENGAIQELHLERSLERGLVGNVYLGKVARVLPGMQSAFIDIGLERAAFLHVADLHGHPSTKVEGTPAAIETWVDSRAPLVPMASLMTCTVSVWPSKTWRSIGGSGASLRVLGCPCRSATCRKAARSRPMSTKALCMPGSTRATLPR